MSVERTACILCSRNCGLVIDVDDGHFARIRGDAAHPLSKGYLCQKAARLEHYQHHANRLRQPLKRQPDGQFVPVSWDEALGEIAERLLAIRTRYGGDAFAFVGGGGQGNHLGGVYSRQLLAAMGSRFSYNSLAQEKTGDFWVNGRLFGRQSCHTTEDVEHADYVLFIGCNPYESHGIPNARDTLRAIKKASNRTMVVIDPRRTETARMADIHLQLRPGADACLLSAVLALIVREGLHDRDFLARRCTGFERVEAVLRDVPIEDYVARADVSLADVQRVARGFAQAERACVRVDLGIQHTLHCTLNGYLEKLLYLLTGHFGERGGNNLHTSFIPIIGHTDEREIRPGKPLKRTAYHGMPPIAGMYPPNLLPDEILHAGDRRVRAVCVDSSNPALTYADTEAQERALQSLDLLVVVDVAMTETARFAHYVLPAATQFEKAEATGFTLEFPDNYFHLRHAILSPTPGTLAEPEIYTRLLERMGKIPPRFPTLERVARLEPSGAGHLGYLAALAGALARRPRWAPYAASITYRSLGPTLPTGLAAAAVLLPIAMRYASDHRKAVRRAGHNGMGPLLGSALFHAILKGQSGVRLSRHEFDDTWSMVKTPDRRVHLAVPEMLEELQALASEPQQPRHADYPLLLMAGERRAYNANQIFRDPAWRKVDHDGAMRMHPADAGALGLEDGAAARCASERGEIAVVVRLDDSVRPGVVTLPHGYGQRDSAGQPMGPVVNRLTATGHCDQLSRTPFHKYVPVRVRAEA